jgi:hypothetical protein
MRNPQKTTNMELKVLPKSFLKMDRLINFKSYIEYGIRQFNIKNRDNSNNLYNNCLNCHRFIEKKNMLCNNYDCANDLLLYISENMADVNEREYIVSNKINPFYKNKNTDKIADCIKHIFRTQKIKYNKNCACCNRKIPYGLIICRSTKCISKFLVENCKKYKEFRVDYNRKYEEKLSERDKYYERYDDYDDYHDYNDYNDRDSYDDYDRYSEDERGCLHCDEGGGGTFYTGCSGCGTLSCGCIDVCRGRCGRDDYW